MNVDKLRVVHQATPFRPFRIHLADGSAVDVTQPESLAYSPRGRTVVIVFPDESSQWIDLLLVSRIEIGNGRTRRTTKRKK